VGEGWSWQAEDGGFWEDWVVSLVTVSLAAVTLAIVSTRTTAWGQCYKNFYGCDLQIFVRS